jgi:hypothetical protein
MIGYVTVGTNALERAAKFYDAIAAELGTSRMMEFDGFIAWGTPGGGAGIAATKPFDGKPATVGNGVMVAFEAKDHDHVISRCRLSRSYRSRSRHARSSISAARAFMRPMLGSDMTPPLDLGVS